MTIEIPDRLGAPLRAILEREAERIRARRRQPRGVSTGEAFDELEACRVVGDAVWAGLKEAARRPEYHVGPQGADLTGGVG